MAMGRRKAKQKSLFVEAERMPLGPRHRFYDALNGLLDEAGFDVHVEGLCELAFEPSSQGGRPSIPPGVYFRMLLLGYFEGIESERGICWRCEDSLSLKRFLGYEPHEPTPDHSTLSRMRARLPERTYQEVFRFVMRVLNEKGLLQGKVAGVDATYLRADASMKTIVRKGSGEGYKGYLRKLAKEAGIEQPTDEELRRLDRKRKGKRTSNEEWESPIDPDAEIVQLKDGRTRLGYKAEHVVDMQSGALLAVDVMPATTSDAASLESSLEKAEENLDRVKASDDADDRDDEDDDGEAGGGHNKEVVGDKGYHKASTIRQLEDNRVRT
jgi:transposase